MPLHFSKKNNPRVIIIQKLYSKYYNNEVELNFPKHRFKKFIKDVVNGTIERDDVIHEEITNHLNEDLKISNLDKVFQVIIKSAIFELMYKPKISSKISDIEPEKFALKPPKPPPPIPPCDAA